MLRFCTACIVSGLFVLFYVIIVLFSVFKEQYSSHLKITSSQSVFCQASLCFPSIFYLAVVQLNPDPLSGCVKRLSHPHNILLWLYSLRGQLQYLLSHIRTLKEDSASHYRSNHMMLDNDQPTPALHQCVKTLS